MNTALQAIPTYVQEKIPHADVPIQYTAAVKALAECRNIDDAKYFADKSEALAAWAKIYKHDEALIAAKRVKLHAYRRMGLLAAELQPIGHKKVGRGAAPGPVALLREKGLTKPNALAARRVALMPEKEFQDEVNSPRPKSPFTICKTKKGSSEAWQTLTGAFNAGGYLGRFLSVCQRNNPRELACSLTKSEAKKAREMITEIIEWADTFEQYLPRD